MEFFIQLLVHLHLLFILIFPLIYEFFGLSVLLCKLLNAFLYRNYFSSDDIICERLLLQIFFESTLSWICIFKVYDISLFNS